MRFLVWLWVLVCTACAAQSSQPVPATPTPISASKEPESPLLPIYADDLAFGASDPLVTIVAFLDFAKPESKTRYLELVELLEQHPELRLVVKQAPLSAEAEPIAEATLVVADSLGPKAAKEFLGRVSDASNAPSKEELAAWALGLAASSNPGARPSAGAARAPRQLQKNLELALRLEVYEPPVLFVNGVRVDSDPDADSGDEPGFLAVFQRELDASRASRKGSPSSELHYARRVEENWVSPIVARPVSAVSLLTSDGPEPSWGSPAAPVTLVEFTDFECPFCSRVVPTLNQLKQKYGPKQLRIVFKHNPLPFHKAARPAAEAAVVVFREGGDAAFWGFHARLFENQKALTEENLARWAQEVGVSPSQFRRGLERGNPGAKVDADIALARKVGATGTPTFRINGVTLSGAQPVDKFSEVIDEQLTKAAELVKQGIPYREVSAVLTSRQLETPTPGIVPNLAAAPAEDLTVWRVPISATDPVDGPADALVTLIEFSDLQCPFCKRVQPTLKALQKKYGADLRIVWKDNPLPFHLRAKPAASVARSIYERGGASAFWRSIDAIFESQPKLEDDDLKQVVEALGGSWQHALKAVQSDRYASKIAESQELANDYQARGTPHFFINGVRLSGAQPLEKFEALIDDQLKQARVLLAAGVPRSKVFETVMSGAKEPPGPEKKQVAAPVGGAPFRGPAKAKVVIQIFSDFQCPFCSRVNPTLDAILKAQPGVKLVWRNLPLPFHKDADLAAQAAHEVYSQLGNQGFWRYHKLLFEAQKQPDGLSRANLETLAQQVGVNMPRFRTALDTEKHRARIDADKAAAQGASIMGTPSFVIGDYFLSGAQQQAEFEKLIRRVQTGR